MLFVAAAGNSSTDTDQYPNYPSGFDLPNIVAVAATDDSDQLAGFSNYGATSVDLGAPGVNIYSTVPTSGYLSDPSGYMYLSGTSMATPHVSGAAALVFAQFPNLTHHDVKARLIGSAEPVPSLAGKTVSGGRLNAMNAFDNDTTPPAAITDVAALTPSTFFVKLSWTATGDDGNSGTASSYDVRYSTQPIDDSNFDAAPRATVIQKPQPAGTQEVIKVGGLDGSTHYWFAVKALDHLGNASPMSNVVDATTTPAVVAFQDDMESGAGQWTVTGTDGNGGPALWHLSTHRSASPSTAFYYGIESTLNYDTGAANSGVIVSPPISVGQDARLTFNYFLETENGCYFDAAKVQVLDEAGNVLQSRCLVNTSGGMQKATLDLSGSSGSVRLRFYFDTLDSLYNQFEGWVIDDVKVESGAPPPDTAPVANVGGPYSGFKNEAIAFDGTGSTDADGDPLTYQWTFGAEGLIYSGAQVTHAFGASGTYAVRLDVSDGRLSDTAQTTVTIVNRAPTAVITAPARPVQYQSVTFSPAQSSDPDGDPLAAQWDFGDGATGSGTATHAYQQAGTYTARLTVTDTDGASAQATKKIVVVPPDTTPDPFSFPSVTDVKPGATITSAAAKIAGTNAAASISVAGGTYSVNGGAFTDVAGQVPPGASVRLRHKASSDFSTSVTTTVTIGGVSATFTSTTRAADTTPDPFAFTDRSNVARNTLVTSNRITPTAYDEAPISVTGGAYSIDNAAFTTAPGKIKAGQGVRVQQTSSAQFATSTTTTLTIGGVADDFVVKTVARDVKPDAFAFAAATGVPRATTIASDAATIGGINDAAPVSVSGGEYSVDGGAFTSAPGSITAGQSVGVRHVSSADFSTSVTTTLTVGGVSAAFSTTTLPRDISPDPFSFPGRTGVARSTLQESDAVTITGINDAAPVSVSEGEYSIDGGPYTSTDGTVAAGHVVRVRQVSAAAFSQSHTVVLSVGDGSATFTTTTEAEDKNPDPFTFTDRSGVTPAAVTTSNTVTIAGINTPSPISVSGADGQYSINGRAFTAAAGWLRSGDRVTLQVTAPTVPSSTAAVTLTVGGTSDTWTVKTLP